MDTTGGGSGGGGMNWAIGIDMYTLICIKWMINMNLLYLKKNKKEEQVGFIEGRRTKKNE